MPRPLRLLLLILLWTILLGGGFVFYWLQDADGLKPSLEGIIEAQTGIPVRVDGALAFDEETQRAGNGRRADRARKRAGRGMIETPLRRVAFLRQHHPREFRVVRGILVSGLRLLVATTLWRADRC